MRSSGIDQALIVAALILGSNGCSKEGWSVPPDLAAPDSVIAANPFPWPGVERWRVPIDSPVVDIADHGDASDDNGYGISGGIRLTGDRIVVVAGGPWCLRVYDRNADLRARFRMGAGPQELPHPPYIAPVGRDSVLILSTDGSVRFLTPNLELSDIVSKEAPDFGMLLFSPERFPDGRWLAIDRVVTMDSANHRRGRSEAQLVTFAPDFSSRRILASFPDAEENSDGVMPRFGWNAVATFSGYHAYVAFNAEPVIDKIDTTGKVVRRIRVDLPPKPVTRAAIVQWKQARIEQLKSRGLAPQLYQEWDPESHPSAKIFPYFSRIHASRDGYLWAARFKLRDQDSTDYLVFDPDGVLVATVSLPGNVMMGTIWSDMVGVIQLDENEVASVKFAPLRKSLSREGRRLAREVRASR